MIYEAETPLNNTPKAPVKPDPEIVTWVPTGPAEGKNEPTITLHCVPLTMISSIRLVPLDPTVPLFTEVLLVIIHLSCRSTWLLHNAGKFAFNSPDNQSSATMTLAEGTSAHERPPSILYVTLKFLGPYGEDRCREESVILE